MGFERAASKWLLITAIALRILVYVFLQPLNNDDHGVVIQYFLDHGRLATVADTQQGQHPPLYYLIAAPVLKTTHDYKMVQLLSLWFSILTLLVLHHLIYQTGLIPNLRSRTYVFLFACFLPQFVLFTLYLSNDSLTILLGNLAILQAWRAIQRPTRTQWLVLALITALGMLTKLTLLAFVPVLCWLVFRVTGPGRRGILNAAAFGVLVMILGGYKLAENYRNFGELMPTNMDARFHAPFARIHATTYRGAASYLDFNVLKLITEPVLSPATSGSYPVILYATFWYQYIPESSFIGNRSRPTMYIGSIIYLLGLLPTAVFLLGVWSTLRAKAADPASLARFVSVLLMLFTGLMFVPALVKYHVWSIVQARYLFPALFGCLVAFANGVEIVQRHRAARIALAACMAGLTAVFLFYYAVECAHWM